MTSARSANTFRTLEAIDELSSEFGFKVDPNGIKQLSLSRCYTTSQTKKAISLFLKEYNKTGTISLESYHNILESLHTGTYDSSVDLLSAIELLKNVPLDKNLTAAMQSAVTRYKNANLGFWL